jgi:DNA-binding MarR family transcriptional regulator
MGATTHDARYKTVEPPLEDADYRQQAEFRYAIRRFSRFSEDQARLAGITPQQHLLLLTVRGHQDYPRVSIKDVAERLQIRHHSASLLLKRGVSRGLLAKAEDAEDKRKTLVSLTQEGQRVLDRITHANREELRTLDEALFGLRESLVRAFGDQNTTVTSTRTARRATTGTAKETEGPAPVAGE